MAWLCLELVVRCSAVPVLVVRGSMATADPPGVLAAVDPFDLGARGLVTSAAKWAQQLGARLDLVHVVSSSDPVDRLTSSHVIWSNAVRGLVRKAKSRLADLARTLPPEVSHTIGVEFGDPCAVIADLSPDYTLTVVRTHGRRGLARLYLGSVSEHIVREAASPVLVLPGPQATMAWPTPTWSLSVCRPEWVN
jgi:nucleotide-binding universal stress UspA family protein